MCERDTIYSEHGPLITSPLRPLITSPHTESRWVVVRRQVFKGVYLVRYRCLTQADEVGNKRTE